MRRKKNHHKKQKRACPLGTTKPDNACAYCHLHKRDMTVRQMRNRNCLGKGCRNLVPRKQHPYWAQRAKTKTLWWEKKETTNGQTPTTDTTGRGLGEAPSAAEAVDEAGRETGV